jgi:valyl-tRNA synthetase
MMDNRFDPSAIEARIASRWAEANAFAAMRPGRETAEPYCIVIPPPNVTGSLHIGHALNNTLQDVLCRYWRMKGRDVLWQPGTDHAGIATQMMVERKLAAENRIDRRSMGREAFLKEVWAWKEESGGTIVNQLKRLGASCDWSRERFTMDPGLSKAVLKVFVELHRKGMIYKARRLVNWDPKLLTAISDLEVEQREIKGHMWYFRYPLEGVAFNPEDATTFVTIATTRPETMLGDGAVAVHPDNETIGWMIGKTALLPLVNRRLPIIGDTYADPEKGTGAVKITAAHDFNDYEVYRRHSDVVPLINLFTATAQMVDEPHMPEQYRGLDRYECRKRVVADLDAMGLVAKIEPHVHSVPHGDRSGVVIEPWLTEQWYVDVKPMAEKAMAAVREGRTRLHPPERDKVFFNWMENIEPWCVSRQLWWGHQIPVWYGFPLEDLGFLMEAWERGEEHLGIPAPSQQQHFVCETEFEAIGEAQTYYARALAGQREIAVVADLVAALKVMDKNRQHLDAGEDWLVRIPIWRDPDVLDTWFSSALWPFSTLGWPDDAVELKKFYPTNTLVTAADILFFWVARMMMMGQEFMGQAPFADVILHGIVRDEKGKKMSKTTGNVIDPLTVIDQYGADAMRFTLAAMTSGGRDIKLSMARVEGYRNFATKIWNAARFAEMNGCARVAGFDPRGVTETLNKWVIAEAAVAARDVAAAIEAFRFSDAADAAYRFVWGTFCDWYVELSKPVLQADSERAAKDETRATVAYVIDIIAKILHPFMPFMTEELWAVKGAAGPAREGLLCHADWPDLAGLESQAAETEIGFVVDLISEIRSVRTEVNVAGGAQVELVIVSSKPAIHTIVRNWDAMIVRQARASSIRFAEVAPPQSAQIVVRGETIAMPLAGLIDLGAEKARLTKELGKLDGEIAGVERKLFNPDFVAKAPEEVIEENRERIAEAKARQAKIRDALDRLG